MRVLYIAHTSNLAGSNKALLNIVTQMKKKGHVILVITNDVPGALDESLVNIGVLYKKCRICQSTWHPANSVFRRIKFNLNNIFREYRSFKDVDKIVKEFKPDIIHSNVGPLAAGIYASIVNGIPHVWHQREFVNSYPGLNFFPSFSCFLRLAHYHNNYNICITHGVFENIQGRKFQDVVIYDGVFSISELPKVNVSKEKYILFVGNIHPGKGPLGVITAFGELHKDYPDYKLLIAGNVNKDSAYYKKCIEEVGKYKIEELVKFLGLRSDVYSLMSRAKMIVVNSEFEGFGFITAEAMLNDCVVVGKNTTGTKEQFDVGLQTTGHEIGIRFSDRSSLLLGMKRAIDEDLTTMRQLARQVVIEKYSLELNVDNIIKYYNSILEKNEKNTQKIKKNSIKRRFY